MDTFKELPKEVEYKGEKYYLTSCGRSPREHHKYYIEYGRGYFVGNRHGTSYWDVKSIYKILTDEKKDAIENALAWLNKNTSLAKTQD